MIFASFMIFSVFLQRSVAFDPSDDYFGIPITSQERIDIIDVNEPVPTLVSIHQESGCLCREIPEVYVVCFGRSNCDEMPRNINTTTPGFKLINTHISVLKPGDFDNLHHLDHLQIEGNVNLSVILPGTLNANLTNLTNLSISYNPPLKTLDPQTFEGLINLRYLFLIKNGFTNLYDIALTLPPAVLPNLVKLCLNENSFVSVSAKDFTPMKGSSIEELNLVLCRLETLDPDSFAPLKNLQALRLGENGFDVGNISAVIERSAELDIPLKLLNLYSAGFRTNVPRRLLEAVSRSKIIYLNLAGNQFEIISGNSFPYMPHLRVLDLRDDLALDVEDDAFSNLPNLKTLLLSGNKLPTIPKGVLLPSLKNLDLQQNTGGITVSSYFSISNGIFSNMSNLIYLNLNFNNIYHLFTRSFVGLNNLEVLGLKNSTVFHIQNFTFSPLKKLVLLNLENNDFVRHNYPFGIWPDIFNGLENLKVLLLGNCGISYFSLYGNAFVHLKSLVHLGLQKNQLKVISSSDFIYLTNLRSIDLSYNWMKPWDKRIFDRNQLKTVILHHNKLTYLSTEMLQDFANVTKLDMSYNSFTCDCFTYSQFKEWSLGVPNNTILKILDPDTNCITPSSLSNYSLVEYLQSVENHTINCDIEKRITLIVILPLILLLLLFVSLAIFVYYYRWHIKYWIFLSRLYLSRKGKIHPKKEKLSYTNYIYDAFISYSTDDRNFVVRLVSMLENYEPYLKLCVYERDFEIGSIISESILEGVAKSRKTVLIISDSYAKSQWCRWESQLAEHHRLFFENEDGEYVDDTLILVKLGPVNNNHLTPTLKYLLKTRIYLDWEVDDLRQKVFWDKLRQALRPSKKEILVFESTHM